ncbi:transcriptional regulator/sugar kinase [Mycolicibacterium phlei]|uniref:ROK family transcriptional regulator n=1 Tax=Mycolicibacterium phlei DSM 43239 = CCUG 21000 TaxID=1226750 RepID=A0A5N5UQ59_MYCPH|nr:ROK family protein [Mycolicibacterium phlei]VEG08191.1 transcriptional regulator/sugar kinase [Mycobacteroides chelonae]AMO60070.1 N-acetylmannosamine kinase [Mycolicibacterium phlei]KAB7751731.1 ROK family transcriptional regulator [Mycolicibacterium phlei DSM 43239 = CCUG 21000]KXW60316.1 ROK family transcriptional regulator [Mycolicibacterium phlei DSM 43239 = CCUG 21000]KXW66606.1 ROK family transcriptional regulator [Mycolicibacterium phlei DSM 43072]
MAEPTLALDIGGTKIAVGLVDDDGSLLHRAQLPTPDGDPESIWAVVDSLLTESLAAAGGRVRGVGIASAGPIDLAEGTVSPINIVEWQRFPIVERVSTTVGAPTRLGGDGLCMALGERWRGAGRGADFLLGMVVSTGVGGGLVLDGAPYDGRTGNAGHVGHVVVDPDGAACTCGGRGCVETIAAGPRMVEWARSQGWVGADAKELADAAAGGDAVALRAYRRGATAVAAMIASVGAVCDLDRVVIGGGVAKAGALLFEPLREALASYAGLSFLRDLQVLPAELGGDAGLVGAAALVSAGLTP